MQGPNVLDLARTLANEHLQHSTADPASPPSKHGGSHHKMREWVGRRLINTGERLIPRPTDLQLKASTGPPCP